METYRIATHMTDGFMPDPWVAFFVPESRDAGEYIADNFQPDIYHFGLNKFYLFSLKFFIS